MSQFYVKKGNTGRLVITDTQYEMIAGPFTSHNDAMCWLQQQNRKIELRKNVWYMVFLFAALAAVALLMPGDW